MKEIVRNNPTQAVGKAVREIRVKAFEEYRQIVKNEVRFYEIQ